MESTGCQQVGWLAGPVRQGSEKGTAGSATDALATSLASTLFSPTNGNSIFFEGLPLFHN